MRILDTSALCLGGLLIAAGCAATNGDDRTGRDDDDGRGGAGSGASTGAFTTFPSGGNGGGSQSGCSDAAQLVYVLSDTNELYSFDPPNKQFKKIGPLGCATSMQPNSMAVDRDAVAWVNYVANDGSSDVAGSIFRVDTSDGSCSTDSIALASATWFRLGMGFSSDAAGGDAETLFITGTSSNAGLGRIDQATKAVVPVGQFTGKLTGQNAELTGTGDGRLFGFFTSSPVQVAEIDKTSGAILSTTELPTVEVPAAWAFSFWGGDFYLYTAPFDPTRTTNVTRYRPSDNSVDTSYMTNIGFRIVGAGVSTCAPIAPPT